MLLPRRLLCTVLTAGSSTQVGVLVVPFCVVLAWVMGKPLDLNFNEFEALVLFISVLLAAVVLQVGAGLAQRVAGCRASCAPATADRQPDAVTIVAGAVPCACDNTGWHQQLAQRRHAGADLPVHRGRVLGS
jgi:hypothetical protein